MRIKYDADGAGAGAAVVIAGARTDSLTFNNERIDITSKDEDAVRTLLNDIAVKSMSLSCTGVLKDATLAELAANAGPGTAVHVFEIDLIGLRTYRGAFFLEGFTSTGEDGANPVTFSVTLESAGVITSS